MRPTSRRAVLTSVAAVAGLPLLNDVAGRGHTAMAAPAAPTAVPQPSYASYTDLFNRKLHTEGKHWARRFRRVPFELIDNASATSEPIRSTAIIAPHGGGIEDGTSELCLAIAGYTLTGSGTTPPAPLPGVPQRDYWMFEGLEDSKNLHVTSTLCDDPAALHICGSSMYAVSVHGFDDGDAAKKIIIGGAAEDPDNPDLNHPVPGRPDKPLQLKKNLRAALARHYAAGGSDPARAVEIVIASPGHRLDGDDPDNIVNRTRTGFGAQLEISRGLRTAMFGDITSAAARRSTAGVGTRDESYFWNGLVNAVREAVDDYERGIVTA
ncbi:poly-gamma-glutamate hydrolase family protein [Streptomyces sp. NPDC091377]|uniref:poly-gamma-glutamate hydrolase family protein n=1 Tax=Streptomyces sp. NPDC091377 TaxID=3365995 RepID=UPI0037FB5004